LFLFVCSNHSLTPSGDQSGLGKRAARQSGAVEALVDLAHGAANTHHPLGLCPDAGGCWEVAEWTMGRKRVDTGESRCAALRCMGVLASACEENKQRIVRVGGVPVLVALVAHKFCDEATRDFAALSLSNISYANEAAQQEVRLNGGISALVIRLAPRSYSIEDGGHGSMETTAGAQSRAWGANTLARVVKDSDDNKAAARSEGAMEYLLEMLDVPVTHTQLAAIGCIKRMLERNEANKREMYRLEGDARLIALSSEVDFEASGEVRNTAAEVLTLMGVAAEDPNSTPRPWV